MDPTDIEEDPRLDPRTHQANERTLLAWMRTGLALITFGFLIARMGVWLQQVEGSEDALPVAPFVGGLFVILGAAAEGFGIWQYLTVKRALDRGEAVRSSVAVVLTIAISGGILGLLLGISIMVRLVA